MTTDLRALVKRTAVAAAHRVGEQSRARPAARRDTQLNLVFAGPVAGGPAALAALRSIRQTAVLRPSAG
jgi:hypothetical protein